ncbi:MAG: hypothetical protein KGH63_04285 [Candidatus Micrarchaeota archaeon]|nr:hypothetical protein [Candidatus Micrarchaeota archaeon]
MGALPPKLHTGPLQGSKLVPLAVIRQYAKEHHLKIVEDEEMIRIVKE